MIGTIASKKACAGADAAINTGKLGCLSLFGTPAHVIALTKGFEMLSSDTFNDAYLRPLVQQGKMVPLIDASNFEDLSGEDGYSQNAKNIKRLNVKGLPEYKLWFEEGHEFYREIDKMESFKRYDFLIGDTDGNWMIVRKSNGNFQGFTAGHVTPELTKRQVEGGDPEMKAILMQFTDRLQWDRNYEILHAEDLDLTPQEIPTINGTEISLDAIPADTDTTVDVTVVLAADRSTLVEGLTDSDFVVNVNGVAATISGVVENTPGKYTITVSAAFASTNVIDITHFHGGTNTLVADSNGVLYRNVLNNASTVA